MSLHSYKESQKLMEKDPQFDALIMAAMRKADTFNSFKLKTAFPEIYEELQRRYSAPGGRLPEEEKQK